MGRRKRGEENQQTFDNAIEALTAGTSFQLGTKTKVLNSRNKVRTPVEVLNCILGGGLPFGTIAQSYGPPKVGKSTWMYQMMGIFQKQYPDGIAFIIDNEASADDDRLEILGVDKSRVLRLPASSIESGFLALLKLLENKASNEQLREVPVFGIWDTISKGLAQDGSTQSRMNAQDRARIIKNYMSPVIAQIEKQDFILCLLNQVIYTTDRYGNRHMDAGGGVALKHDVHFSTVLTSSMDSWEGNFLVRRITRMDIDKSKLGPEVGNIPVVLDIKEGAIIDEVASFNDFFIWQGWINESSGWYRIQDLCNREIMNPFYKVLSDFNKSYRYNEIVDAMKSNQIFYHTLRYVLMKYLSDMYKLQSKVIKPYLEECIDTLRKEFDPPEMYFMDNPDKRNEVFEFWRSNPEVLEDIRNVVNEGSIICLHCGVLHDNLYPWCDCESEWVVSTEVAKDLIDEFDKPTEVDEEDQNGNETE